MFPARIRYQTIAFDNVDLHVKSLLDNQQFHDPLGEAEALGISSAQWPLFGVVWDSGIVLASEMENFAIKGKRILEVGCGIGLPSLMLNARKASITATDYHPEVASYLLGNAVLNQGEHIPFLRTDWNQLDDSLGEFDVVIGADLLYEQQHINLLSAFIDRHAKPQCEVVLVDPRRGNQGAFTKQMQLLGYTFTQHKPLCSQLGLPFKGQVLNYQRQ